MRVKYMNKRVRLTKKNVKTLRRELDFFDAKVLTLDISVSPLLLQQ